VILLDVDRLGKLNAREGYDTGDRLLERIGDVLRRAMPEGVTLEPLDNGRFAVWMPAAGIEDAANLAERLRGLCARALVPGAEGTVARSVSAGVTAISGEEGRARSLLHADEALVRAKAMGGDRVERSSDALNRPQLSTRQEVADAIATGELAYHLQPIVDLRAGRPVGAEALLRWHRPDGRLVGPDSFVDQIDRIPAVGADLIRDLAVSTGARHLARGDGYITFNVTGAVFDGRDGPGLRWLEGLIDELPPERLVLEIVESALIVEPARCAALIDRLRARGIRIALDDFGTGLSNLERLCSYRVDILKIDRGFVRAMGGDGRAEAVLSAINALALQMGLEIVAEGVETEEQASVLRDRGIPYGQGWLYGRPAPNP
jgi:diguanylate cyclase (GGDEF)-like protein